MRHTDHPCGQCTYHSQSLWQPVTGAALSRLVRNFNRRELPEGSRLYHQGEQSNGVYCVSRGLLAIRAFGPDGSSSLLRLAYPGEIVGYRAFLTGRPHRTEAQALVPSRVCIVAPRDARYAVNSCPAVLARLAGRFADELDRCHERIHETARVPNDIRLMRLFERLMEAHGAPEGGTMRMRLPISRRDLADILGVQPETLSRLLRRLESDGVVRISGRMVEMPEEARDRIA